MSGPRSRGSSSVMLSLNPAVVWVPASKRWAFMYTKELRSLFRFCSRTYIVRGGIAARTNLGMYAVIGLPRLLTAYATSAGMVTFAILIFDTLCLHRTPSGFGWVGEIWG